MTGPGCGDPAWHAAWLRAEAYRLDFVCLDFVLNNRDDFYIVINCVRFMSIRFPARGQDHPVKCGKNKERSIQDI